MSRGWWIAIGVAAIVLAIVGYFASGHGSWLVSLLTLFPAGKNILRRQREQGVLDQATADRAAAQEQREGLQAEFQAIDTKTEQALGELEARQKEAEARWQEVEANPTEADEKAVLDRFPEEKP